MLLHIFSVSFVVQSFCVLYTLIYYDDNGSYFLLNDFTSGKNVRLEIQNNKIHSIYGIFKVMKNKEN